MSAHRSDRRVSERELRTAPAAAVAMALCAAWLTAQAPPADEFVRLEPVVQQALAAAAPFTVMVETFGGTRQVERAEGPMDGEAPPKARPRPAPKPQPKPKPDDAPDKDADKDDGKDGDKQPKKPLVAPATGFQQAQGRATGVVLTADGWILVARFALALEPTTILVTVPGVGTFPATRAGEDTSRGLALVKIEASGLPTPTFVDPADVRVGQWAFALGRTFAAELPTVHFGIVSAKGRQFGRALQIDAGTSPANYGGPVVDVQGRVLGVAVPLSPSGRNAGVEWYDSGVGFAATIADIGPLLARMQQGQALQRGWLGVQFDPAWLGPGAKVVAVDPRGPAHAAGVQKGDVLLQVGGVPVRNAPHALACISGRLGGDALALAVRRADGSEATLGPVLLADAPWSEQQVKKGAETPASFSLPEPQQGR